MQPCLCYLYIYTIILLMHMCRSSIAERWALTLAAARTQSIKRELRDDPCVLQRPRIDAGRSPFLAEILIFCSDHCWAGMVRLCSTGWTPNGAEELQELHPGED